MRNKNFIIIVIGQIISLFGNSIQRFSMSLYLLELTGSAASFAKILAISTIPYVLFAPIAGKLSDSVSKKKIMVYIDFFLASLICLYAMILFSGNDSEVIVGIVMFLLAICYTLYGPAVVSSIPVIVEEENLTRANGIINGVNSVVNFVGPIFAGVLYGFLGIKIIVIINGISFLASGIMELFLDMDEVIEKKGKEEKFIKKSFIDMKESYIYLRREKKAVFGIILSYGLCNIFLVPILSIVAPYFINVVLGLKPEVYGIVEGICVLGMILGGLLVSLKPKLFTIKKVHYTYIPMIIGVLIMSTLGIIDIHRYVLALLFGIGGMLIMFSLALSNVVTLTFIQKEVVIGMLGRVSAFSTAIATISVAPGQILFGQAIEIGIPIEIILGVTFLINIGLMLFIKWNIKRNS
ncbi:MAG: MFS transporter [Clostridium sp.]|uniref:MFS transporter n=1 Tax=Clostridium sp. TaxID=1506 RepID=UPI003F3B8681